jgi:hypothetical protein
MNGKTTISGTTYAWIYTLDGRVNVRGGGKTYVQDFDGEMLHDVHGRLSDEVAEAIARDILAERVR